MKYDLLSAPFLVYVVSFNPVVSLEEQLRNRMQFKHPSGGTENEKRSFA